MPSSGCDVAVALMNSQQQRLPAQGSHEVKPDNNFSVLMRLRPELRATRGGERILPRSVTAGGFAQDLQAARTALDRFLKMKNSEEQRQRKKKKKMKNGT